MTESDRSAFAKIMMTLAEIYDKKLTDQFIELYMAALQQYTIHQIESATVQIIRTKTFHKFPVPAEFIEIIDPPEEVQTRAVLALDSVFQAMEIHGAYASVAFDDPVIHAVISYLGGWERICLSRGRCTTDVADRFWRNEFCDLYRHFRRSDLSGISDHLAGILERQNTEAGYTAAGLYKPDIIRIVTTKSQHGMLSFDKGEQKRITE